MQGLSLRECPHELQRHPATLRDKPQQGASDASVTEFDMANYRARLRELQCSLEILDAPAGFKAAY